jgi:hypothetical protein
MSRKQENKNLLRKRQTRSDGRYYRKSIEIIDTYKSIDTFDTQKSIGNSIPLEPAMFLVIIPDQSFNTS